jgi:hypothetical protein
MRGPLSKSAWLAALALWSAAAAWSAGAERYPLRQIDRPLVLPAKMWQERLIQNSVIVLEGEDDYTEPLQGFWPGLPAYSFTDRLMWLAIPAPYFRYLLIGNTIDSPHGRAAVGLSLAVDAGLIGAVYSQRDGTSILGTFGFNAKRPFSSRVWGEGQLGTVSSWNSYKADEHILSGSAGLGFQVSERMYLKPTYGLNLTVAEGHSFSHFGTLEAGVNFTPNLSLGLQVSLAYEDDKTLFNPGANLAFQW